jgi:putative ABC transport system ATP-binding protein
VIDSGVAGVGAGTADLALELIDVVKEYAGEPPVRALDSVSLEVQHGELTAIVGPSGSGKSTLLHIIGTLDRPSSGTVRVAGIDTSEMSDRQLSGVRSHLIGFVFQSFFLLEGMSALDNVANGLLYRGKAPAERRDAAAEALGRVGLGQRLTHTPGQMSGGERQRVAIARAIVNRPSIVLADEPTGNLDSRSGGAVMDLLRELHAEGRTILIITHDRELAASLPRRVSMRDGSIESIEGAVQSTVRNIATGAAR